MSTTTITTFSRLLSATNELLANLIDAGQHKPDLPFDGNEEDYPLGEDGEPWFPDVWELHLAEEVARKDKALYDAASDLLESAKLALVYIERDEHAHGRPFGAGNALRSAIAKATAK